MLGLKPGSDISDGRVPRNTSQFCNHLQFRSVEHSAVDPRPEDVAEGMAANLAGPFRFPLHPRAKKVVFLELPSYEIPQNRLYYKMPTATVRVVLVIGHFH